MVSLALYDTKLCNFLFQTDTKLLDKQPDFLPADLENPLRGFSRSARFRAAPGFFVLLRKCGSSSDPGDVPATIPGVALSPRGMHKAGYLGR